MRMWMNIAVRPKIPWPTSDTLMEFEGTSFTLKPRTPVLSASVLAEVPDGVGVMNIYEKANRLLSVLSWRDGGGIQTLFYTVGSVPLGVGNDEPNQFTTESFDVRIRPVAGDSQRLGIALYREAAAINSLPHQLLGFFKILNVVHSRGADQQQWINGNLHKLKDRRAKQRVEELTEAGFDVGKYLWVEGRNAVAHAFNEPLVNPDRLADIDRIAKDVWLMQKLAEIMLESDLGVVRRL
jgi:hypothetical protein